MKTIIVKSTGDMGELVNFVNKLEKYIDKQIEDAVVCTRYMGPDNYNGICGEIRDAVSINDFDVFIVGVTVPSMEVSSVQALNRAHTLVCDVNDISSAKNYIIMI